MCELCHDRQVIWTAKGGVATIVPCPQCNQTYRKKMGYKPAKTAKEVAR